MTTDRGSRLRGREGAGQCCVNSQVLAQAVVASREAGRLALQVW